jgi:hypothetical protein
MLLPINFLGIIVDRAPYVSNRSETLCFTIILSFQKRILMEPDSIAIWNRNKIVIALSAAMWVLHLVFIIRCRSSFLYSLALQMNVGFLLMWFGISYHPGNLNPDFCLTTGAYLFEGTLFLVNLEHLSGRLQLARHKNSENRPRCLIRQRHHIDFHHVSWSPPFS